MYKTKLFLLATTGLFSIYVTAQDYLMDGSPITDCQGSFFDSGGNDEGYSAGENLSTLICSDNVSSTHVRLNFYEVEMGAGDQLHFYDGTTVDPALLIDPLTTASNLPFSIQPTANRQQHQWLFTSGI